MRSTPSQTPRSPRFAGTASVGTSTHEDLEAQRIIERLLPAGGRPRRDPLHDNALRLCPLRLLAALEARLDESESEAESCRAELEEVARTLEAERAAHAAARAADELAHERARAAYEEAHEVLLASHTKEREASEEREARLGDGWAQSSNDAQLAKQLMLEGETTTCNHPLQPPSVTTISKDDACSRASHDNYPRTITHDHHTR